MLGIYEVLLPPPTYLPESFTILQYMLSNHEFGLGENVTHEDHLFVTKINLIYARGL